MEEYMPDKKEMTVAEITALVERFIATIPKKEFEAFGKIHSQEISQEYQVILLMFPYCQNQYSESVLRQAALVIVYTRHHKDDDGWRRPPKPRPEPPTPQGNGVREILEYA